MNGGQLTPKRGGTGLNSSALLKMPTIEEREGEWDMKEEIEKKERNYLKTLTALETDVEKLKS